MYLMEMRSVNSASNIPTAPSVSHNSTAKHAARVMHLMNEHRKTSKKLCDVTLKVGDRELEAHRSVLAACSPYFLAMFNGELKESTQRVVTLKGLKYKILEILVEFAYTGILDINIDNVQTILSAASLLQFPEVAEICGQFLEHQLEPSNCIGIRKYAEDHNCSKFLPVAEKYIMDNYKQILQSEEFHLLSLNLLLKLVSSCSLNIHYEEQVYNGVIKWIRHDMPERGYLLPKLLAHVRLPLLPISFIVNVVEVEPMIRNSLECRDLVDEAKNYHLQPENHSKLRSMRTMPRRSTAGLLVAVGGKEAGELITNKVECFSLFRENWRPIAPLVVPRQQLGVCQLRNRVYAIAGSDGVNRLNSVEVFTQETNAWEYMTPLKTCRSGVGVGVLGEAIFALGGYDGRLCLDSVERFDSDLGVWDFVASLNHTRSFPGVAVHGGRMYVIGGNDGTNFLCSCEVYDPLTNKWTFIAPMHRPRAGVGAAVVDGNLYVAGGFDGFRRLDLVEMYEPRMNAWTNVSSMKFCRDGVSLTKYGNMLYAIGGIDGPSYLNCVEYYDPSKDEWHDSLSMETSRAAAGVAVINDSSFGDV